MIKKSVLRFKSMFWKQDENDDEVKYVGKW